MKCDGLLSPKYLSELNRRPIWWWALAISIRISFYWWGTRQGEWGWTGITVRWRCQEVFLNEMLAQAEMVRGETFILPISWNTDHRTIHFWPSARWKAAFWPVFAETAANYRTKIVVITLRTSWVWNIFFWDENPVRSTAWAKRIQFGDHKLLSCLYLSSGGGCITVASARRSSTTSPTVPEIIKATGMCFIVGSSVGYFRYSKGSWDLPATTNRSYSYHSFIVQFFCSLNLSVESSFVLLEVTTLQLNAREFTSWKNTDINSHDHGIYYFMGYWWDRNFTRTEHQFEHSRSRLTDLSAC